MEPARFDEMRKGCWDIHARIADMDVAGIWASLCFPSLIAGFAGAAFARSQDPELGLACVRAWNDWHHEVWAGTYPERIIPLQLAWLRDPEIAAADVRRNAERGFKAVTFPESMNNLDLPVGAHRPLGSVPARRARRPTPSCASTPARASISPPRSPESPLEQSTTLFPVHGMLAAADWLWARIPLRFPRLNVALSEGGIGWVPMLLDRLDYVMAHSGIGRRRRVGRRRHAVGSGAAQLLVLHHRRPDHPAGARPHRRRPHHGGERLPPRRLVVARHPGAARRSVRRPARRRRRPAHPRERRPAVPPPAAAGRIRRPFAG